MSSNSDYSSCFEQNNSFIVNMIHQSNKNDENVPEFFQLLTDPDKKLSKALYKKALNKDDIACKTESNPYPEPVMAAIRDAKDRVELGTLIPIEHYSCIVDNKLFIWPMVKSTSDITNINNNSKLIDPPIVEKCERITCVSCGASNQAVTREKVTHVIVVASNRDIIIYPVLNRNHICYSNSFRTSLKLCIVTSIAISDKGKIFLGSDLGDIFLATYHLSMFDMKECKINIQNLTQYRFVSYIQRLLPIHYSNIIQLSLCSLQDDSIYVASLDDKSRIYFYHYKCKGNKHKLVEISRFDKKTIPETPLSDIIKIIPVPVSDSLLTRFIGFTKDGDRLFFESEIKNDKNEIKISQQNIRHPPEYFPKDELVDASYSLGVTCFMYRKYFFITQTTQKAHVANGNPIEIYNEYKIPENGLVFARDGHIFSKNQFRIFNNEMLWQHLINSSPGYLMTTDGIIKFTFSLPVDRLCRILNESHGNYTSNVIKWMQDYDNGSESSACALLLASRKTENERSKELFILYSYTNQKIKREYAELNILENQNDKWNRYSNRNLNDFELGDKEPESCKAFIIRAARLMRPIWNATIFIPTKIGGQNRYRINTIYDQLPENFLQHLSSLIDLANEYIRIKSKKQIREEGIQLHETKVLRKFISYMRTVIETITFIQILNDQQKHDNFTLLTDAMNLVEKQYQHILIDVPFGKSNENHVQQTEISLFESLHEFAAALFKTRGDLQSLQQQFFDNCRDFFNEDDSLIFDKLNKIENLDSNTPKTERLQNLEEARKTFVEYSNRPLKLQKICKIFEKYNFYKGIVDVCIKRAYSLDREQLALQWYKNGCDESNVRGAEAYDKRHGCYEFIFNVENLHDAFDFLLDSNDEIYHICLYKYLIYERKETGKYSPEEVEELLNRLFAKTTQFLEDYLKEKAPQNLWKYQANHKNYGLAARLLLEIVKDKNDNSFKFVKILRNSNNDNNNDNSNSDEDLDDDENSEIPNLKKRITYLLKVITFARASGDVLLLNEAQWFYRLANIQSRYNDKIYQMIKKNESQNLIFDGEKHYILDQQTLFDKCTKHGFWDLVLEQFSFCTIQTYNKEMNISRIWSNYLIENLGQGPFESARHQIVTLVNNMYNNAFLSGTGKETRIEAENDVLKPSIVLPSLEDFKYNNKGPLMWACETLLDCGISPEYIFMHYIKMINEKEPLEHDKKADFIYIIAKLITQNVNRKNIERWDIKLFKDGMDWFILNANDVMFYDDCFKLIGQIKNLL